MPALTGVETVCLSRNRYTPPSGVAHATPEGFVVRAEFGEDTGCGSGLDAALGEAGAVNPFVLDTPAHEVHLYWENMKRNFPDQCSPRSENTVASPSIKLMSRLASCL